jgi:hypothetical protein
MTRRRSERCASELQLDRLISGELREGAAQALYAHFAACVPCRTRHDELLADHRAFPEKAAPFASVTAPGPTQASRLPRLWLAAGSIAAAAALWMGVIQKPAYDGGSRPTEEESVLDTRTKGPELHLDWVIRRGSDTFPSRANEAVHPGDALRFSVRVTRSGHVAILSLDAARRISVYQEWSRVEAGDRQLLPGAVQLDSVLGVEHVYGIFCEQAWPLVDIEDAIRRDAEQPRLPPGCDIEHHALLKEPL